MSRLPVPPARPRQEPRPATTEAPRAAEQPVLAFSITFERRGGEGRTVLRLPDGTVKETAWRAFDHGMYAALKDLHVKWMHAGPLGGFGRIPKAAQRARG